MRRLSSTIWLAAMEAGMPRPQSSRHMHPGHQPSWEPQAGNTTLKHHQKMEFVFFQTISPLSPLQSLSESQAEQQQLSTFGDRGYLKESAQESSPGGFSSSPVLNGDNLGQGEQLP